MKQKEQFTVYKVCEVTEDNKMVSLHAFGKAQVTYEIGKKSFPVDFTKKLGYGLFAFESLSEAIEYGRGLYDWIVILKCLTVSYKKDIKKPYLLLQELAHGKIKKFNASNNEFPPGTVMCNWLLPIEVISIGDIEVKK